MPISAQKRLSACRRVCARKSAGNICAWPPCRKGGALSYAAAFGTQNPFVVLVPQGDAEKEQQLTEMLLAYTYNGEKVINSAQGAADMGLYTDIGGLAPQAGEYAAQVLLAPGNLLSGIVSAQVQNVVQELCAQLEQWMEEDGYALLTEGKLTLFDAVSYAAQRDFFHNRADDLRSLLEANAGTADLAVTLFRSTMETQYTAASFAQTYAEYGVTAAQASSLWAALGAGEGESLAYAKIAEEAANSGIFSENGQYGAVVSAQSALYSLVGGKMLAERREKRVRRAPLSASEGGSEQANAPESAPTEEK